MPPCHCQRAPLRKGLTLAPCPAAYAPALTDRSIVLAIKALSSGTANEGQQQRALAWIINILCRTYESPYARDSGRDTAFACGKQFCGQQVVGLINLDPTTIETLK